MIHRRLNGLIGAAWALALGFGAIWIAPAAAQPQASPASLPDTAATVIRTDTLTLRAPPRGTAQLTSLTNRQTANRPYRQEPSVYLTAPALRYNRVEGMVMGWQRAPLSWTDDAPVRLYAQASYALALREPRYLTGIEFRPTAPAATHGFKLGVHAGHTTASADQWKQSWEETSVSALLFGRDLFNYYDVRQVTAYAFQRIGPGLQISAGFRWAEHDSLARNTGWSVFDRSPFRPNPAADAGTAHTLILSAETGHLRHRSEHRPVGSIARLYAELGHAFGGSLAYNRYIADGQTYRPITASTNLNLRARAGYATDEAPTQMRFRLNGVHGLRTFEPARGGTRLLLGSAQLAWYDVPFARWMHPLQLSTFADAGWTGDGAWANGDAFAFAGVGAALFDRLIAVDVAWPLHRGPAWSPQVTLKIHPLR